VLTSPGAENGDAILSDAITPLTITAPDGGELESGISAILEDTSEAVSTLNVMILPQQFLEIALYRVVDRSSPLTMDANGGVGGLDNEIILSRLNALYTQAGIEFTDVTPADQTLNIAYDDGGGGASGRRGTSKDGKAHESEIYEHDSEYPDYYSPGDIKVLIFKKHDATDLEKDIAGFELGRYAFVFADDAGDLEDIAAGHEVGHVLGLSTQGSTIDADHDIGPYPEGTVSLMAPHLSNNRWLRHIDWSAANENASIFIKQRP